MRHLLVLLLLICSPALASAPCIDTDPNYHDGPTIKTSDGACQVWFCSYNHKWEPYALCGTWAEITGATIQHILGLKQGLQSQRDKEWDALIAAPPAAGSPDDRLLKAAMAVQHPTDIPADGLVVQNQNAYRITSPTNAAPAFQLAGSVPLGTQCDTTQKLGKYYRVDRTKVVIPKGALLAPAYYANCDP